LKLEWYDIGDFDWIYGPRLRKALIKFQKKNNLKEDGLPWPKTVGKLLYRMNRFVQWNKYNW
jgi:peptidoglycan hydrolase-like protein with peptidoglycan-binding domain